MIKIQIFIEIEFIYRTKYFKRNYINIQNNTLINIFNYVKKSIIIT